ncbi:MAG TPA: cupin domain-containing protein [Novosphingobium sp.]
MRRVVTGLNADGKSCVLIDGEVPRLGPGPAVVWRTGLPADNVGSEDTATPYDPAIFHDGGSTFMIVEVPPGYPHFMHATDTIDYLIVLAGELVMELETGEARMGPGTFIVDRGVIHAWRNDGPETVVLATVILPAHPEGKGATL